ncbi:MAG: class I SAM-dependent methyltransferase [Deltaproteobacteria bacterium]|nr:class I SAM-dependent methyltransferase [Deltaproteobacteria bacterium]
MTARDREDRERGFFDRHYEGVSYHPDGWKLRMERDLRVLLDELGDHGPGRVLSIGCGDGAFELLLARHATSVLGVDLSPAAIAAAERERARQGVANASFRCTSFRDLAWQDPFDTIVCLAFLHHVPEPELDGFLRSCREHLAPRGLFFSQDPNVHGALRAAGRVLLGRRYDAFHTPDERELDPEQLRGALRAAGFGAAAIRHVDLALIPACYLLARGPAWPLRAAAWADRLWCASPLARWSSGFVAVARNG